ncbi:MAG: 3-deoxy-D-manno-octulosonate 8-phosphate phosphatase (KDO 8-P phosphatase) [Elusimicrobia bacterium]|nr:MAG: 3-deoxy-D-manno-octulosonate 8-phosphate phosphatase (KDO 8-P phosphatase) [Elusimicrobiota bacterium]
MDVDGVLTDGKLYHLVDKAGELVELKGVDTQDGLGLAWLAQDGLKTGVISGRSSAGLAARARMLKMTHVVQGTLEKTAAWERILRQERAVDAEAAFIGDDLPDLPLVRRAGFGVAVANARPELKKAARYVTKAPGGAGALREVAELILKARGGWDRVAGKYLS